MKEWEMIFSDRIIRIIIMQGKIRVEATDKTTKIGSRIKAKAGTITILNKIKINFIQIIINSSIILINFHNNSINT